VSCFDNLYDIYCLTSKNSAKCSLYLMICEMRIIEQVCVPSVRRMIDEKCNFCSSCILGILNYFLKCKVGYTCCKMYTVGAIEIAPFLFYFIFTITSSNRVHVYMIFGMLIYEFVTKRIRISHLS